MKTTVYLSRKLLNQLKVKETESKDLMKKLHDKILTFGGDEVCMTMFDEDAVNYSAIELPSIKRRGLTLDSPRA